MSAALFLLIATFLLAAYLWWGFRFLPAERWQIVAAVPTARDPHGNGWLGINITWYGLLTANAYLVAVAVLLVLLGSVGVSPLGTALLAAAMLCCCVPASRLVARIVEKKAHTFTVGGAVFVGIIITPFLIGLLNRLVGPQLGFQIPVMAAYAAIAIAYAFGEGLGRLACISFGCCYGKPVPQDGGLLHRLFSGRGFVFRGSTKKIAYADGMESVEVLPVQALTAVLYTVCGLLATALFLAAHHAAAFLLAFLFRDHAGRLPWRRPDLSLSDHGNDRRAVCLCHGLAAGWCHKRTGSTRCRTTKHLEPGPDPVSAGDLVCHILLHRTQHRYRSYPQLSCPP